MNISFLSEKRAPLRGYVPDAFPVGASGACSSGSGCVFARLPSSMENNIEQRTMDTRICEEDCRTLHVVSLQKALLAVCHVLELVSHNTALRSHRQGQ